MSSSAANSSVPESGYRRAAVILLGIVGAIQVADPLISSLALVKASNELHFSASIMALAAGISTIALAATCIPGGLIADRLGRRPVLMASLLLAALGQILTAVSFDSPLYLLGRVITGIALGVTFGASYGMLKEVAATKSLGPAMALFSVMNGIVPVIAMIVTGVVVASNWRIAYVILPIISIICFPFIPRILPRVAKGPGGRIDYAGIALVAIGVSGLLYGISSASLGFTSPQVYIPIVIGVIAFAVFAQLETKSANPVFPIRLLAHPAFLRAVIMGVFWNFGAAAISQMIPNIWQYVTHLPAAILGLAQLPSSVAGIAGSIVAGSLLGKGVKSRTLAITGYGFLILGFLSFTLLHATSAYLFFVPGLLLAGFGYMMDATTQGNLFIRLAPAKFYGAVTSSKTTVGQFGYALGLTATTAMISIFTLGSVGKATNGAVAGDGNWNTITAYLTDGTTSDSALGVVSHADLATYYTDAFRLTALIVAIVIALAGVGMFLLQSSKKADVPVEEFLGLEPSGSAG